MGGGERNRGHKRAGERVHIFFFLRGRGWLALFFFLFRPCNRERARTKWMGAPGWGAAWRNKVWQRRRARVHGTLPCPHFSIQFSGPAAARPPSPLPLHHPRSLACLRAGPSDARVTGVSARFLSSPPMPRAAAAMAALEGDPGRRPWKATAGDRGGGRISRGRISLAGHLRRRRRRRGRISLGTAFSPPHPPPPPPPRNR